MSFRMACLVAPLALFAVADLASAQNRNNAPLVGSAYRGTSPQSGIHAGYGYNGGYGAPGYRGNLNNYGYRGGYSTFNAFGVPNYGGLGYPYGGMNLGFGFGGLGYGYGMGNAYSGGYRYAPEPARSAVMPRTVPAEPVTSFSSPGVAVVNVTVPDGAKVWFDGKEVETTSGKATYTSPTIAAGHGPTLTVKARWDDSTREMHLTIRPGDNMNVDLRKQ